MYSSTLSLTWALKGRALPPGKTRYPLCRRLGGGAEPVWAVAENLASHRDSIPGASSQYGVDIPTELSTPTIEVV
jgi:hypothetical protein